MGDKNESLATEPPRGTDEARSGDKALKGDRARMGAKSSISHQKGSRVKAEMGAWGLGSNISLKRFLGWKMGSPRKGERTNIDDIFLFEYKYLFFYFIFLCFINFVDAVCCF